MINGEMATCPVCESPQKFVRRLRAVIDPQTGEIQHIEAYVECKICHKSVVLGRTTEMADELRRDIAKLNVLGKRGFNVSRTLAARQARLVGELKDMRGMIDGRRQPLL